MDDEPLLLPRPPPPSLVLVLPSDRSLAQTVQSPYTASSSVFNFFRQVRTDCKGQRRSLPSEIAYRYGEQAVAVLIEMSLWVTFAVAQRCCCAT